MKSPVFFGLAVLAAAGLLFIPVAAPQIHRERLTITTSGAAGSAAGSASTGIISGRIVRVDIDYSSSAPNTTDLTIAGANDLIATNVVNRANTATDAQLFPTVQLTANDGTARTLDGTRPLVDYYPVNDKLTATIAQSDALTPVVTIDIFYEDR